jgi:hypothetical protein
VWYSRGWRLGFPCWFLAAWPYIYSVNQNGFRTGLQRGNRQENDKENNFQKTEDNSGKSCC